LQSRQNGCGVGTAILNSIYQDRCWRSSEPPPPPETVVSVAVTLALASPVALAVNVAAPVLEASAAMVTVCAVAKLPGVKVSVAPELTDSPVLPDVRLTVTVTLDVGAVDSDTPKVPLPPWATDSAVGLATTLGVLEGFTVIGTAEDVAVVPAASKASAVSE